MERWYSISTVTKWSGKYGSSYDVSILYASQDFMDVFKLYMKKYLFDKYYIRVTGVHPDGVPPETLWSSRVIRYSMENESLRRVKFIDDLDETTNDLILKIERSMNVYMRKFIDHIYSIKPGCFCCFDTDRYLTRTYRHSYDVDTEQFETTKKVYDRSGKRTFVPYVF